MSRAVPLARPARGPLLVLLVALPLLCLVEPAAGAGSAYGFNTYDADKNGKLEPIEFVKFLQNTPAKGSKKGQVQQMFKGMDTNNDNGVSEDEFNVFLESMAPPPPPPKSSKSSKKPKKPEGANTRDEFAALEAFYAKHDPKKIAGLPKLLARAAAKNKKSWFQEMSKALEEKYGDSPANYMPGASTPGAKAGKNAGADRKASKSKEKAADKLRQSRRQALVEFYKKHVPEKTASDVDAIIAKRESKGKSWFGELCAKLKAKYGEDPADGLATGSGAAEGAASSSSSSRRSSNDDADSESKAKKQKKTQSEKKKQKKPDSKPESSSNKKPQSDKKKKRGTVTEEQRSVLAAFYARHAPKKTAKAIAKMIASTSANEGDDWFDNLCAALKDKYGEDPRTMSKADATKATGEDTKGTDDAATDSEPKASEAAAGGGEGGAPTPAPKEGDEGEAPTVSTEAGTSERQKLLDRLLAAVGGIDDLGALEEELVKKAEALQEVAQEKAKAAEKEAQAKAEEEARIKAEKKAAARKRAAEARAAAAEKLKAAEEAEEAALNLESFDPIDLDDESNMVLMDSEVVAWLEENRLSGYTHQIARFGGKLSELRMRVKAADMEAMGMSKPEMARMKKALKKLRKEARELAAAQAAAEDDDQAKEDDDVGTDDDAKETKKTSKAKA